MQITKDDLGNKTLIVDEVKYNSEVEETATKATTQHNATRIDVRVTNEGVVKDFTFTDFLDKLGF